MTLPAKKQVFSHASEMELRKIFKDHFTATVLFCISLVLLAAIVVYRFSKGLGITGLNDMAPWGIWTAFKLSLIVSSGGAFVVSGMVYLLKMERFRPLVRAATLGGFIGYTSFALTLLFELGFPWRIAEPLWLNNFHSILFEIAWCVMLYLTILTLELLPNLLEHLKLTRLSTVFEKITPLLVIAGIVLSLLHQSSLGSLFVVAPYKMNQLFYTPWIGIFFVLSSFFCGLSMVMIIELAMASFEKREPLASLVADLGRYSTIFLALYLGLKVFDIAWREEARDALTAFDACTFLFLLEIGGGVFAPLILFTQRKVRQSMRGLGLTAVLVVLFGGALNRLNVSVIAFDHRPLGYVPTFIELIYVPSLTIIIVGIFVILSRTLPIYDRR